MYYDFQLNKNGDILFKQSQKKETALQFDFYVANTKGMIFNFYIDNYEEQKYLNDLVPQFAFKFYVDTPKNNKDIMCIDNKEDYLYQQIKIRLNSALGTIKSNENIGSTLDNYRHILLNPDKNKGNYSDLILCVKNAIKDILPNAEITIYNSSSIYTDFTNSIVISIIQDDLNYYYYL